MSKAKYWKFGEKYAGITKSGKRFLVESLSKARAKIGKSTSTSKSTSQTKSKKRRKTTTTKTKSKGKGGKKLLGSLGWKGLITGIASMTIGKILVRRVLPQLPPEYVDPLVMSGAGAIGKFANLPTKNLLPAGVITGASTLITDLLEPNGLLTIPRFGGNSGGYDV